MPARTLMIQGTASNVGKSVLATALCRYFKNQGMRVAPFKAQNMSNNSFVTQDGGEIGRAQAVQAEACGVEPSVLMNPILLKPNSDKTSQVVVLGKVKYTLGARDYHARSEEFGAVADQALRDLREVYDVVVIEGAGSPAEVNIKDFDITNMRVARNVSAPVVLVGDIDQGGIFAQLVGTFELLPHEEQDLVRAFVINKFRGDKTILDPGVRWIEEKTNRKVLGVLPYLPDLEVSQEDSVFFKAARKERSGIRNPKNLLVHVIQFPRISNFTDFEALNQESQVDLRYLERPDRNTRPDLLILPGSKNTMSDLEFLKRNGWAEHIERCHKSGVPIVGICGGFQMLGEDIWDPQGVESNAKHEKGLGLLPIVSTFHAEKQLSRVRAVHLESNARIEGYEIHMGRTEYLEEARAAFQITERDGKEVALPEGFFFGAEGDEKHAFILGTYIHGLFDVASFRKEFLSKVAGLAELTFYSNGEVASTASDRYDRLVQDLEPHLDFSFFEELLEGVPV